MAQAYARSALCSTTQAGCRHDPPCRVGEVVARHRHHIVERFIADGEYVVMQARGQNVNHG
jgi:hypothetical protein